MDKMQELKTILNPKNRVLTHLLFWVAYTLFHLVSTNSFNEDINKALSFVLSTLPVRIVATYFFLYLVIPKLLDTKRYLSLALTFLVMGIVFGYLNRLSLHVYYVPTYRPDYDYLEYPLTHLGKAIQSAFPVFTVVFAAITIKLVKRNYEQEQVAQDLANEKLDAELKFLKGQIHPHFLFNTLNNLYAITLQDSPKASEVVMKLSTFLDYMLYEANVPRVSLRKEIDQMRNLIELERLRYGNRLEVVFSATGAVNQKSIPPLLMLPFVENAFKHGVSKNIENSFISIDIDIKDDRLNLRVENSKGDQAQQRNQEISKGIGLKNVRRRLELIYGPKKYSLQVFDEEEMFMIVLKVPLFTDLSIADDQANLVFDSTATTQT